MVGVELFCGAGGMALGAVQAGIDVRLAVDSDPYAASTYKHNHPKTKLSVLDIRKLHRINIHSRGKERIIFGGPPCRGFSISNQRTRCFSNPGNWLFLEFIRIVKLWRPDWVVFENVKGIIETEKGFFLARVIDNLEDCGYTISWWVLNSADFGVPQVRYRLFVIGSLHGIAVKKPKGTISTYLTVGEALSDLPCLPNGASVSVMHYRSEPTSEYAKRMRGNLEHSPNHLVTRNAPYVIKRYKHIPPDGNWQSIPKKLMFNYSDCAKCHTGIYHRLANDRPSVVIGNYRKNMLIHPEQDRGLSVREAARLQSFPDWYEFKGSIGFQQQQVGNAVPPLLAKKVFDSIRKASK